MCVRDMASQSERMRERARGRKKGTTHHSAGIHISMAIVPRAVSPSARTTRHARSHAIIGLPEYDTMYFSSLQITAFSTHHSQSGPCCTLSKKQPAYSLACFSLTFAHTSGRERTGAHTNIHASRHATIGVCLSVCLSHFRVVAQQLCEANSTHTRSKRDSTNHEHEKHEKAIAC